MLQIVQRAADKCAVKLMRQAVGRHQDNQTPPNYGHGCSMVGTWSGYGRIDLVKTYLAKAQNRCAVSLIGIQGGGMGYLSLRGLRANNGPWRVKCPDMQHFQTALCLFVCFVCLFVWVRPENLYFAPCVWREVITVALLTVHTRKIILYACMLEFHCTLEIITRILREVVNRERLCGTNTQASWLPQFLGLSDPLQK